MGIHKQSWKKHFANNISDFDKQQAELYRQRAKEIQQEKCHNAGLSCHQSDCEKCYPLN